MLFSQETLLLYWVRLLREESRLFQHIIKNDSSVFIALDPDAEEKAMKIARCALKVRH